MQEWIMHGVLLTACIMMMTMVIVAMIVAKAVYVFAFLFFYGCTPLQL